MCRLIGYVSAAPVTVAGLVDPDELAVFTSLSTEHKDGWGVGWRRADGGVAVLKGTGQAWQESAYHRHLAQVASDQQIVHLRKASAGMVVEPTNCHPFVEGEVAFCHNGQFDISPALLQSVVDRHGRPREGTTDSEFFFALVLLHARTLPWPEAIAAAVREIVADTRSVDADDMPEAVNCLLTTPDALYAYNQFFQPKVKPTSPPDTYRMQWAIRDDAVIVTSSCWPLDGVQPMPVRRVVQVDRGSLRVTVHPTVDLD